MPLGAQMTGGTMTYTVNGRQFLVAVVNGTGGNGAELVALAIPPAVSRWSRRSWRPRRSRWRPRRRCASG